MIVNEKEIYGLRAEIHIAKAMGYLAFTMLLDGILIWICFGFFIFEMIQSFRCGLKRRDWNEIPKI